MGIFSRLFSKNKEVSPIIHEPLFDAASGINTGDWIEVFSACLGKMYIVQNAVAEHVIGDLDWNMDFERGIIRFGKSEFPMQLIGTESTVSNTWLWGWNNISDINEQLLTLVNAVKQMGEHWNLEPLTVEQGELDEMITGHALSIVACGISAENWCYYRGEHSDGAVFVAFSQVPNQVFYPVGSIDFSNAVMQCIQQFELDHKIFVESFLRWNGTEYEWQGNNILAKFDQRLKIQFQVVDGKMRISQLRS